VTYYLNRSQKNINEITENNRTFKVLDDVVGEFTDDVKEELTSPYMGWFYDLPTNKDGYDVSYDAEDSKFDINHIDLSVFSKSDFFKKDKKNDRYLYYIWEVKPFLNEKVFDPSSDYAKYFTVCSVPNLNVSKVERVKMFLESQMIPEEITNRFIKRLEFFRGGKNYLTENGLLINEDKYLDLRNNFPKNELERFYALFDFKGKVNLNFVTKEVFELGIRLCNTPKANIDEEIKNYWKKISGMHNAGTTINNLKEIFGNAENKYMKYFSVDSSLFKVTISKKDTGLTVYIRKYKDNFGKNKIEVFKTSTVNREFKIPDETSDATSDVSNDKK
jgi:hypothetical protein